MSSKAKKEKKPNGPVLRPIDFQRQFKYIPLHILRKHTNIENLIIKEFENKNKKRPMNVYINRTLKKYHNQMLESNDWTKKVFNKIDFNWPKGHHKIFASVYNLDDEEKDRIHNMATSHQKKFLYLPRHLFRDETNIQELIHQEAAKSQNGKDLTLLPSFAEGVHQQLHLIKGWHTSFKELKFKDDNIDDSINNAATAKQTPSTNESKSKSETTTSEQNKLIPSTSKQADPVPSTSKQAKYAFGTRKEENKEKETISDKNFANKSQTPAWQNAPEVITLAPCDNLIRFTDDLVLTEALKTNCPPSIIAKRPRSEFGGAQVRKERQPIISNKQQDKSIADKEIAQTSRASTLRKSNNVLGNADNAKEQTVNDRSMDGNEENNNFSDEILTLPQDIPSGSSSDHMSGLHQCRDEPSDFQASILALNFDEFIDQTNIKEIIKKEHYNGSDDFSQEDMQTKLKYYYDFRVQTNKWHKNAIKNLQRKRKTENKAIQTEPIDILPKVTNITNVNANNQESNVSSSQNSPNRTNVLTDITQRRLHLSTEEQAVAQAVVQSAVEQSNIAQSSNNDETQFFSSGTIPDSGQEALGVMPSIQHVSIVSASQAEPSSIVSNDEELSQAVAPPQSQQILSIEHVRMSEMIAHTVSQVEDITARNPLETQPVIIGECSTRQQDPTQNRNQSPTYDDFSNSRFQITQSTQVPLAQNRELIFVVKRSQRQQDNGPTIDIIQVDEEALHTEQETKQEPKQETLEKKDTLDYHLGDDSDVELVDNHDNIVEISDDSDISRAMFDDLNKNTHEAETLLSITTQPDPEETELSRRRLIETLEGTPEIEDSESSTSSPFKNIQNIGPQNRKKAVTKRPQNPKPNAKRQKLSNDDLSKIPAPVYNYQPLQFMQVNHRHQLEHSYVQPTSQHIEKSQQKPDSSNEFLIEDSNDLIQISGNNGIVSDTCIERAHLLNQDNTLFLYINTQPTNSDGPSELNQLSTNSAQHEANMVKKSIELDQIPLLAKQPSNTSTLNGDRFEFLHYINILSISSKMQSIQFSPEQNMTQLNINATLQHQCNGNNRIVVTGNAIKLIMKLNDEEWGAVHAVLSAIKEFQYDSMQCAPKNKLLLHRSMYHLLKTMPKISNVYIAYGDQDFETARVFLKPYFFNENVTTAISPYILYKMKSKAIELKKNHFESANVI